MNINDFITTIKMLGFKNIHTNSKNWFCPKNGITVLIHPTYITVASIAKNVINNQYDDYNSALQEIIDCTQKVINSKET